MIVPGSANALMLGQSQGYNLTKSLRFRSSASAYMNRTNTTATNTNKWTWSGWVKRGTLGSQNALFGAWKTVNGVVQCYFQSNDTLRFYASDSTNSTYVDYQTNAVYRDPSAWYHVVVAFDNTGVTASVNIYVNGTQVTSFGTSSNILATNSSVPFNLSGSASYIGQARSTANSAFGYFDGYMAEVNFIDGQALTPSSFGSTNALTGVWQPAKYTGTYGTNGFYLPFTNTTSTTTLGYDFSGNSNNWTTNNFSLTAGTTYDSMTDVPTLTSNTTANYCVWNAVDNANGEVTLINANLEATRTSSTGDWATSRGTMFVSSGKYYFEMLSGMPSAGFYSMGFANASLDLTGDPKSSSNAWVCYLYDGNKYNGSGASYGSGASATTDVFQCALDLDNGKIYWGKNGTWFASGDPAAGTNAAFTNLSGQTLAPVAGVYGNSSSGGAIANFGQRPFAYTPPTGFVALNTYNLPTSTIVQGNKYMDATLYTGNATITNISNSSGTLYPDFLWIKARSSATDNILANSNVGVQNFLVSNSTGAEQNDSRVIRSVTSGSFQLGTDAGTSGSNQNGVTYVGWQWQAGQGTTSSNTNGSITSTVSVNASAGFSVVTYTGNGSAGASIGHGLGVTPSMVMFKDRSSAVSWIVYHTSLGSNTYLTLNNATSGATATGFCTPSSSTITFTNTYGNTNTNGDTYVAYCWTAIAGYSAFSGYTGNGSTDGVFVYTGFRPRYVMIKRSGAGDTTSWFIFDTARDTYNIASQYLLANDSGAEGTYGFLDILSNGFKIRSDSGVINSNSVQYIYMAFAENPFKNALAR